MLLSLQLRIKGRCGNLNKTAAAVNTVWNFCNQTQKHALRWDKKWPSGFDLAKLTAGYSKLSAISSASMQMVCYQYDHSRRQRKKPYLRWRGKKSLGWIPIRNDCIKQTKDGFKFMGKVFKVFNQRPIPEGSKIHDSSFSQDAQGKWYLNLVVDVPEAAARPLEKTVGIDLGLKTFAALSTGEKIDSQQFYKKSEEKLAKAQRARKRRQVPKIHAKIRNQRKDFQHKLSNRLTKEFDLVVVGDINSSGLAKTNMAKSVSNASWFSFKNMLKYKSIRNGSRYLEVNENFTTQDCSACFARTGPKGIANLGIRDWSCPNCGAVHDRDVNSAKNILRIGYDTLTEGSQLV